MSKYINPPTLSTNFSERGKRVKKRFENILNAKAKKTGFLAFVLLLILVGIIGALISFSSNNNILYTCKTFDCSFELPQSWENKYEIEEKNNNIVYVYHKVIREKYGEGTGLLFYIEMLMGDNLTHEQITEPGNRAIALQEGGYTYVFGMPTDVQYPVWEGGDKNLADEYVKISKDNVKIKKSIRRVGNGTVSKNDIINQKIHDVLPLDSHIMVNSGMNWRINIPGYLSCFDPEKNIEFNLRDLENVLDIDISDYFNKDLDVLMYAVGPTNNNMQQKYATSHYIFVFDDTELIVYKDLQTNEKSDMVRDVLIGLNRYRNIDD